MHYQPLLFQSNPPGSISRTLSDEHVLPYHVTETYLGGLAALAEEASAEASGGVRGDCQEKVEQPVPVRR